MFTIPPLRRITLSERERRAGSILDDNGFAALATATEEKDNTLLARSLVLASAPSTIQNVSLNTIGNVSIDDLRD